MGWLFAASSSSVATDGHIHVTVGVKEEEGLIDGLLDGLVDGLEDGFVDSLMEGL